MGSVQLKWNKFLHNGDNEVTQTLLNGYYIDEEGSTECLGIAKENSDMGIIYGHQGSLDSYNSFLGYIPKTNTDIVILSNNLECFNNILSVIFASDF